MPNDFNKRAKNLQIAIRLKIIKRAFELDFEDGMKKLDEFLKEMLKQARKNV
ncbi:hypothetical protein [Bacillus sp. ISL-46]|uniref:hypothetical protein n=1 Tax=Bacillus sp. ISL-46 TaxID=2819129 RepID=UPI001BE58ED9|nr:hypothetical protein [Bacillus sp. ISL-46]MBT2721431.1 hypothetical protein [Bacillus sp. ISL-46]